jgi:hypothetical protein
MSAAFCHARENTKQKKLIERVLVLCGCQTWYLALWEEEIEDV